MVSDEGGSKWAEKGGAFLKSADHSQFYEYKLQNWLQWLFKISAKAAITFFIFVTVHKWYDSKQNEYCYATSDLQGYSGEEPNKSYVKDASK